MGATKTSIATTKPYIPVARFGKTAARQRRFSQVASAPNETDVLCYDLDGSDGAITVAAPTTIGKSLLICVNKSTGGNLVVTFTGTFIWADGSTYPTATLNSTQAYLYVMSIAYDDALIYTTLHNSNTAAA
jgi:hypothetical protein